MKRIQIYLKTKQFKKLKKLSGYEGITMSELVRNAVKKLLTKKEKG